MKTERPKGPEETPSREKEAQTDSEEKVGCERRMAREKNDKILQKKNTKLQLQRLNVLGYDLCEHESVC